MERPLRFTVTHVVPTPNEDVWRVLGDFGREHQWTTTLSQCTRDTPDVRVGTVRTCRLPRPLMGRTQVREALTEFEPGHSLAYALDGSAGPFATASSRWSTSPVHDDATAVTVEGMFTPKNAAVPVIVWPFAKPMLRRLTKRILGELEGFLPSP
jgi:uncharacterized protein YndB with AHSA1/START domain